MRRFVTWLKKKANRALDWSSSTELTFWSVLTILAVWALVFILLISHNATRAVWYVSDEETLRAVFASAFQGLAAFFAIIMSASLLAVQLVYSSFSPRLVFGFFSKNKTLRFSVVSFLVSISLNLILLSLTSEVTVRVFAPWIAFDILISLWALVSIIPAGLSLFEAVHPMNIGWRLVEMFNTSYFKRIESSRGSPVVAEDEDLPLLQTLTVKAIREGDTDYAQRLLGSLGEKIAKHLTASNPKTYAKYFNAFFRKVISTAAQEGEEGILEQLVLINEELEAKSLVSEVYLRDNDSDEYFSQNIILIAEKSVIKDFRGLLGTTNGAMRRLAEKACAIMPVDDEIAMYRFAKHLENKDEERNQSKHYDNERAARYIENTYFDADIGLACIALETGNLSALHNIVRDVFWGRWSLAKLTKEKHGQTIRSISYSVQFGLSRLSQTALDKRINLGNEIASGLQEAVDFFLDVDTKLAEAYIDILGEWMIGIVERDIFNNDPNATFFWGGIALRMFVIKGKSYPLAGRKLLHYFGKTLEAIRKKQLTSSNPILERLKETIREEVESLKNFEDVDATTISAAQSILGYVLPIKQVRLQEAISEEK